MIFFYLFIKILYKENNISFLIKSHWKWPLPKYASKGTRKRLELFSSLINIIYDDMCNVCKLLQCSLHENSICNQLNFTTHAQNFPSFSRCFSFTDTDLITERYMVAHGGIVVGNAISELWHNFYARGCSIECTLSISRLHGNIYGYIYIYIWIGKARGSMNKVQCLATLCRL